MSTKQCFQNSSKYHKAFRESILRYQTNINNLTINLKTTIKRVLMIELLILKSHLSFNKPSYFFGGALFSVGCLREQEAVRLSVNNTVLQLFSEVDKDYRVMCLAIEINDWFIFNSDDMSIYRN